MEIKGTVKQVVIPEEGGIVEIHFEPFDYSMIPLIDQLRKQTDSQRIVEIVFIDEN